MSCDIIIYQVTGLGLQVEEAQLAIQGKNKLHKSVDRSTYVRF